MSRSRRAARFASVPDAGSGRRRIGVVVLPGAMLAAALSVAGCKPAPAPTPVVERRAAPGVAAPAAASPDARAMRTVFGGRPKEAVRVGDTGVLFAEGRVVHLPDGDVLVASGTALGAAHPDPGYLGLWYLDRTTGAAVAGKAFPGFIKGGTFGKPPAWTIRTDLDTSPVIVADGFGQWAGHGFTCTTLVALDRAGPRRLAPAILTGYRFDPGDDPAEIEPFADITGTIMRDRKTNALTVAYTGTLTRTVRYRRHGAGFAAPPLPRELDRC